MGSKFSCLIINYRDSKIKAMLKKLDDAALILKEKATELVNKGEKL
jgi:hypothetical protein